MSRRFLDGKVTLYPGDSREVLAALETASVDSVVCDPPYGLDFMGRAWDSLDGAPFAVEFWSQVLRVLKPGGHLVAFSGTRTYHRLACAIEDAGFEIRDQLAWAYGSGFPKSLDVSKAIDKAAGAEREVVGVAADFARDGAKRSTAGEHVKPHGHQYDGFGDRWAAPVTAPATAAARQWSGYGTALKPAWEPIVLARKPLIGTVAQNVTTHGTGALNIDGCRIETSENPSGERRKGKPPEREGGNWANDRRSPEAFSTERIGETIGRWPANLLHDGSEEVVRLFPEGRSAGDYPSESWGTGQGVTYGGAKPQGALYADSGSAARFFYTSKASADDRLGSKHPTVKPVDLMQWLVRLVTPKGGLVLDPFSGTGTTGEAAWREGMRAILIEREEEYQADIARRMELAANPTKRAAVAATKNQLDDPNSLPLFGGWPMAAE
jgi:DNA modification methylase